MSDDKLVECIYNIHKNLNYFVLLFLNSNLLCSVFSYTKKYEFIGNILNKFFKNYFAFNSGNILFEGSVNQRHKPRNLNENFKSI